MIVRDTKNAYMKLVMFIETNTRLEKFPSYYSLREYDVTKNGILYPSAYQIIVHADCPDSAGMRLFGSLRHWDTILASKLLFEGGHNTTWIPLKEALRDQQRRIKAVNMSNLLKNAQSGNVTAQRHIANDTVPKEKQSKPAAGRGRPVKGVESPEERFEAILNRVRK